MTTPRVPLQNLAKLSRSLAVVDWRTLRQALATARELVRLILILLLLATCSAPPPPTPDDPDRHLLPPAAPPVGSDDPQARR